MVEPLVLASASPQRREILERLGIPFDLAPTHVEEATEGTAHAVVTENARRKALAGSAAHPGRLVLGADTVVALEDRLLGKPADEADARAHLTALSGQAHVVHSAFALVRDGEVVTEDVATALVVFRVLSPSLLTWYLGCGEWEGRAGGYAIQGRGAVLVDRVEGDPLTVVGLAGGRLLAVRPELAFEE